MPGSGGTLGAPWFSLGALGSRWVRLGASLGGERYLAAKPAAEAGTHPDQTTQTPTLLTACAACALVNCSPYSEVS